MAKYEPIDVGPLPVSKIEDAIGLRLAPGLLHFSAKAQEHAEDRHPADFPICLRHLARIVRSPSYVGRGPHERDGFELVGEARADNAIILIAIKVQPDAKGRYILASTYRITRRTVETRVEKGYLLPV